MNKSILSCYQCSKDRQDSLFGNLRIRGGKDEPYFPAKKLFSCEYKMKTILNRNKKKRGN